MLFSMFLSKWTLTGITAAAITLGALLPSQPALAQTPSEKAESAMTKGFRPPRNPKRRRGYTTTTGIRQGSCMGETETAFTVLGPSETLGQAASSRPEFVWHLPPSDIDYRVQFRLLADNAAGLPEHVHTADLTYAGGFMTYQIPANVEALSPNTDYRWQVVVVCNENYLSRSLSQERSFEVVFTTPELQAALAVANSDAQRALAYGEAGLWYDAIAQVAQSESPTATSLRQALLQDLATLEENEQLSEQIDAIAEISAQ